MEKTDLLKQLLYRSKHRGCKETDFLIGGYTEKKLHEIKDPELFARFLEEDDLKIYDWLLGKIQVQSEYSDLINEIREFHQIRI